MKRTIVMLATAALLLGGCGKKVMLKPADGAALPPKPLTAAVQPTPANLLNPGTQARPTRFSEIVVQSQELQSDRFDMPPPG